MNHCVKVDKEYGFLAKLLRHYKVIFLLLETFSVIVAEKSQKIESELEKVRIRQQILQSTLSYGCNMKLSPMS